MDNEADEPMIEFDNQQTANDYLKNVSKGLEEDLHKEMLIEQRNLLM